MWTQSDEAIFDTISRLMTTSNFEYLNEYNRLKPIRPQGTVVHGRYIILSYALILIVSIYIRCSYIATILLIFVKHTLFYYL